MCLEEPDVDDGGSQVDVTHPLAADTRLCVTFTPQRSQMMPLYLVPLYLPHEAFVVPLRTKDPFTEQTRHVSESVRAVVDRFGLLDLTERSTLRIVVRTRST